jgi:hypothetical protein
MHPEPAHHTLDSTETDAASERVWSDHQPLLLNAGYSDQVEKRIDVRTCQGLFFPARLFFFFHRFPGWPLLCD